MMFVVFYRREDLSGVILEADWQEFGTFAEVDAYIKQCMAENPEWADTADWQVVEGRVLYPEDRVALRDREANNANAP